MGSAHVGCGGVGRARFVGPPHLSFLQCLFCRDAARLADLEFCRAAFGALSGRACGNLGSETGRFLTRTSSTEMVVGSGHWIVRRLVPWILALLVWLGMWRLALLCDTRSPR